MKGKMIHPKWLINCALISIPRRTRGVVLPLDIIGLDWNIFVVIVIPRKSGRLVQKFVGS